EALAAALEAWNHFLQEDESPGAAEAVGEALSDLKEELGSSDSFVLRQAGVMLGKSFESFADSEPSDTSATADSLAPRFGRHRGPIDILGTVRATSKLLEEGQPEAARLKLGELSEITDALGNVDLKAFALTASAALHWRLGEGEAAAEGALRAIDLMERLVGGMRVDDLISSFLGSDRRWIYDFAVRALLDEGRVEEAFNIAEKARARALLQQLGNPGRARPSDRPSLAEELSGVRSEILALEASPDVGDALSERRATYDELMIRAKLEDPEYADLVQVEPLPLGALRALVPADTQVIAFYVTLGRIHAWVIGSQRVQPVELTVTPEELAEAGALARRFGSGEAAALDRLYFEKLVAPLLPHATARGWILIPHR
ncbi:MAG: hypothetical protein AAFY88_29920, partial [Acidobacteriota bacterium]